MPTVANIPLPTHVKSRYQIGDIWLLPLVRVPFLLLH
jgi:hypothetical protein